jgi:fatty acid amide hydrolase
LIPFIYQSTMLRRSEMEAIMKNRPFEIKEELCRLSAVDLALEIRAGNISAREVTEAHIRQIEDVDGDLNAVVIPLFDEARKQAAEADNHYSDGKTLGPLHGVPMTIKEQFKVAGTQTTLGVSSQVGKLYDKEGPLLTKLRRAGAIILGKTNVIQTLAGWESDNRVYGRTNNPWDLDRTPGGSSGGESAIIAAGGSPLGLAGDLGGSIRIPAHFCGVHGLKPTSGRLTNDDFPAGLLADGQQTVIPQPGPIARSVADIELAMSVLAAHSAEATFDLVPPVPWRDPRKVDVTKLRIGVYTGNGFFPASPAIRRAVNEAAASLDSYGISIGEFTPPDPAKAVRLFLGVMSAGGGQVYKRLLGEEKPIQQVAGNLRGMSTPNFMLPILEKLMAGRGQTHLAHMMSALGALSAEAYWDLVAQLNHYRMDFIREMDRGGFDALLCPPFATPAVTHGSTEHLFPAGSYANMYNVLGNPAGVVSITRVQPGEESDRVVSNDLADITAKDVEQGSVGLPVGVQVVGRHWREDVVLAVMSVIEDQFRTRSAYPIEGHQTVDVREPVSAFV